jgi:ankyrin repeat protein
MPIICIIHFESVLLPYYKKDASAKLESIIRPLILLDSIGVHIMVYTSRKPQDVLALFREYAPHEYFVSDDDIFVIGDIPKMDVIQYCVLSHNKSRPHDLTENNKASSLEVIVLDEDSSLSKKINANDKQKYNIIEVDNRTMSHLYIVECLYNAVLENEKIRKFTAIDELRKAQERVFDDDQTTFSLQFKRLQLELTESLAGGIYNYLYEIHDYIIFKLASLNYSPQLIEQLHLFLSENNLAKKLPEPEDYYSIEIAKRELLYKALEYLHLVHHCPMTPHSLEELRASLDQKQINNGLIPSLKDYFVLHKHIAEDLFKILVCHNSIQRCLALKPVDLEQLMKVLSTKGLPTLSLSCLFKLEYDKRNEVLRIMDYCFLVPEYNKFSHIQANLEQFLTYDLEKRKKFYQHMKLLIQNLQLNQRQAENLYNRILKTAADTVIEHYRIHIREYPGVPYRKKNEVRFCWLPIVVPPDNSVDENAVKLAVEIYAGMVDDQMQSERPILFSQKTLHDLITYYEEKNENIRILKENVISELSDHIANLNSAWLTLHEDSQTQTSLTKKGNLYDSMILHVPYKSIIDSKSASPRSPKSRIQAIFRLCREGKLSELQRITFSQPNFDINQLGDHNKTLLETACQHGHVDIVRWLVVINKADVNCAKSGYHPIFSVLRGLLQFPRRIDLLSTLLDANLIIDNATVNKEGYPPHFVAAQQGNVQFLQIFIPWALRKNVIDLYGKYPKHPKDDNAAKTILTETISVDKCGNRRGVIAILHHFGVVPALINKKELHHREETVHPCIHEFIKNLFIKQSESLRAVSTNSLLSPRKNSNGPLPSNNSSPRKGSFTAALEPSLSSSSPGSPRKGSFTTNSEPPGSPTKPRLGRTGSVIFTSLFSSGPRKKNQWNGKNTSLCVDNKPELLPKDKAEMDKLEDGYTTLHAACSEGSDKVIDFLVTIQVNLFKPSKDGLIALQYLAINKHTKHIDKLLRFKTSIFRLCREGSKINGLPNSADALNTLVDEGFSLIHAVCIYGNKKWLEHFISVGADLNISGPHGLTPLHLTILFRHNDLTDLLLHTNKVELKADNAGCTPLHYASRNSDDSKTVKWLLEYLSIKGNLMTALVCENCNGESALVKVLLREDKDNAMIFAAMGIWLTVANVNYINLQIQGKDNEAEIRKMLAEIPLEISKRYYHHHVGSPSKTLSKIGAGMH